MSEQDNKLGKAEYFLGFIGLFFIQDMLFGFRSTIALLDTGIVGTVLIIVGLWFVYQILKATDESKEDMDKTIAKYLPMCRAQVEEWIPPEEELMKEELYRRRKAYADEHPGEGEWRNLKNPTYAECVYRRRKKRAERMAKRLAEQEIRNRNFK